MKHSPSKKMLRIENKKKKIAALLEISKLNDKDREAKESNNNEMEDGEVDDDISDTRDREEPKPKRQKKNHDDVACHSTAVSQKDDKKEVTAEAVSTSGKLCVEEYRKLKAELNSKKKKLSAVPCLRLVDFGLEANLTQMGERTPIFLNDVQQLIIFSLLGSNSPFVPRWAMFLKASRLTNTTVLMIEGVTCYDYLSWESACPSLVATDVRVEMISPASYDGNVIEELCAVPLTNHKREILERKYGSLHEAARSENSVFRALRSMFPINRIVSPKLEENKVNEKQPQQEQYQHEPQQQQQQNLHNHQEQKMSLPATDKFPRTELLLSAWQLVEEGYPLPLRGELNTRYSSYVMTRDEYAEVTPSSPMWGLDCEMCRTTVESELTRISIVNENKEIIYDSLVKPYNRIVDYITEFSGITAAMLKNVTKRLEDVQEDLRKIIPPDCILVGQSLNADLHALKMMHPYIIDTSVIYNTSGERRKKTKLARLAAEFLSESIQTGKDGHDSIEDSWSALRLVQLKLQKSIEFGDVILSGITRHGRKDFMTDLNKLSKDTPNAQHNENEAMIFATSLFSHVVGQQKQISLIGAKDIVSEYTTYVTAANSERNPIKVKCLVRKNNKEVVNKTGFEACKKEFVLSHVRLSENESIINVNDWVDHLHRNLPECSLLIVILCGTSGSKATGAGFFHIKKPSWYRSTLL